MIDSTLGLRGQVCAVLDEVDRPHFSYCATFRDEGEACDCGKIVTGIWKNIIQDTGDIYYAQLGAGETPTDTYTQITVATAGTFGTLKTRDAGDVTTVPSGGSQNFDSGYPTTADADTNNPGTTGADIVTFRTTYAIGDANGSITGVVINETGATFGSGSDPLLMSAAVTITKSASQTLAIYVNHTFTGS